MLSFKALCSERGFSVLVVAIIIMLLFVYLLVGGALVSERGGEAEAILNAEQALYIAEAGLNDAKQILQANWSSWNLPSLFPSRSLNGGSYTITVGSGGANTDTNIQLLVSVTGKMNQSSRSLQALVQRYPPAMQSAVYTEGSIKLDGNAQITGNVVQGASSIPLLNQAAALVQAEANTGNGFGNRLNGNYFQGSFPSGNQGPQSLNGVIFVDKYPDGTPANVTIGGGLATTGAPALLIVMGSLHISGSVSLNGMIYTMGPVTQDTSMTGNANVTGGIISTDNVKLGGNSAIVYNSAYVASTAALSLLSGGMAVTTISWKEYVP